MAYFACPVSLFNSTVLILYLNYRMYNVIKKGCSCNNIILFMISAGNGDIVTGFNSSDNQKITQDYRRTCNQYMKGGREKAHSLDEARDV